MDPLSRFDLVSGLIRTAFGGAALDEADGIPLVRADFESAKAALEASRWDLAESTLRKLYALATELSTVSDHDRAIGNEFRRRFKDETTPGGYLGVRAELSAAKLLADVGLTFRRGTPPREPDLVVQGPGGEFGVECASLHTTDLAADVLAKIEHLVTRRKGGREYCRPSSVLFVEGTAVFDGLNTPDAPARIRAAVAQTNWGLVLVAMVIRPLHTSESRLVRAMARYPGREVSPAVGALLARFGERLDSASPEDLGPVLVPDRP